MVTRRTVGGLAVALAATMTLAGCVTHANTNPTPSSSASSPSASSTPTSPASQTPTPSPSKTATPIPTTSAPDEGQSFESAFLSGASAACADLANAANNQQVVDTQGRVIDTTNCAAIVKQVKVNTVGLTTQSAAYQRGYESALNVLFANEPLCDPQNNCITKADMGG